MALFLVKAPVDYANDSIRFHSDVITSHFIVLQVIAGLDAEINGIFVGHGVQWVWLGYRR